MSKKATPAGRVPQTESFFETLYAANNAEAHEICSGLFLGAASASADRKAMQKRKISHVLIVHPDLPEQHPGSFVYRRAPLPDEPFANLLEVLPDALRYLANARAEGGRAFVCCAKGISRSASVVIALLMLERGIGFEEAFDTCEKKRSIVYPNVGFQQQLRHLESLFAAVPAASGWKERLQHLREVAPKGSLDLQSSPLRLREAVDASVLEGITNVEALAEKVLSQPAVLQSRELWKRHGLFFENLQRYKALPADPTLFDRAKAAAQRLRALPKVFSESLKGVKLGLAVAKELETWAALGDVPLGVGGQDSRPAVEPAAMQAPITAGPGLGIGSGEKEPKDKKTSKEERKLDKKASKEERKLEKKLAKIEKQAREAEVAAQEEHRAAEEAARRAEEFAKKMEELEAEEDRRAQKRARKSKSRSRS